MRTMTSKQMSLQTGDYHEEACLIVHRRVSHSDSG